MHHLTAVTAHEIFFQTFAYVFGNTNLNVSQVFQLEKIQIFEIDRYGANIYKNCNNGAVDT